AAVWDNDFQAFLAERAQLIADELNRLVLAKPDEFENVVDTVSPDGYAQKVDVMEIRLRDFIDDRLTAIFGSNYWKSLIPSDTKGEVKKRIQEWQSRHPCVDPAEFVSGRSRLEFCDVSDYEKIFMLNSHHSRKTETLFRIPDTPIYRVCPEHCH
ncbi:MAG: hypothetical protein P8020_16570, partial [Acidobacteriota bacterium]